jgi:hypothetical protein
METRPIKHADHTDTETLINGAWAVTACDCKLETKMYTGYTPSATPKPATKSQLLALRDLLLSHSDKNAAAAVDNVIDILSQVVLGKSPNEITFGNVVFDTTAIGENIRTKANEYKAKVSAREAERKAKGYKTIAEMRGK